MFLYEMKEKYNIYIPNSGWDVDCNYWAVELRCAYSV